MSEYTDAVERGLKGLEAISTGICPGCDTCRTDFDFVADEEMQCEPDDPKPWYVRAEPNNGSRRYFATEAEAEVYASEAFEEAWGNQSHGVIDEGSFSWAGCGICGSTLGGDLEPWHYIVPDENGSVAGGTIEHSHDACTDCVMYLANGDEPDQWGRS